MAKGLGPPLSPEISVMVSLPSWPEDLQRRLHNKFAKQAVRVVMKHHVEKNLPDHFRPGVQNKYNMATRHPKYIEWKARHYPENANTALKKTGRSEKRILRWSPSKLSIGGSASGPRPLRATYNTRFAFRGGSGQFRRNRERSSQAITIRQMRREVKQILPGEAKEMAQILKDEYLKYLESHRKNRKRKPKKRLGGR